MKAVSITTTSDALTQKVGAALAQLVVQGSYPRALTILLQGDLGAGKTTFVKGFLKQFGIRPQAVSPTFVIMKHYTSKLTAGVPIRDIYHVDAYRLSSKKDLETLDMEKIFGNPDAIVLMEWPERVKGLRLVNSIKVSFDYGEKEDERVITIG